MSDGTRGAAASDRDSIEPEPPPRPLARGQRLERAMGAIILAGLLGLAAFLPASRPLPFDACVLHRFAGLPCLGCGMTRSIVRLVQGDLLASLRLHPAGPLLAGIMAGLSMRRGVEAFLAREWGGQMADRIARAALVAALFVTLAIRLAGLFGV